MIGRGAMRAGETRRSRLVSVESVAGWVFADLLLVLFLVGLGCAAPAMPEPKPTTEVVKPKPKPEAPIVGMKTDPVIATIRYDARAVARGGARSPQGRTLCAKVRKATHPLKGKRAALV